MLLLLRLVMLTVQKSLVTFQPQSLLIPLALTLGAPQAELME